MRLPSSTTQSSLVSPAASTIHLAPELAKQIGRAKSSHPETGDQENGTILESLSRPQGLASSIYVGLGVCLIIVLLFGFGVSNIVFEIRTDGNYTRAALVATIPIFMLFSLFFGVVIFGDLFQAFGPIKHLRTNTRFHSAIRPNISHAYAQGFQPPRITIQMPVYTESFKTVLKPTIASLQAAIAHYENHRGCARDLTSSYDVLISFRKCKDLHQ